MCYFKEVLFNILMYNAIYENKQKVLSAIIVKISLLSLYWHCFHYKIILSYHGTEPAFNVK